MTTKLRLINFQLFPKIAIGRSLTAKLIALIILLASSVNLVKAQPIPPRVINGLFTPTESDRFFQEGRRAFESEARIFDNPEYYFDSDILQISPEALRQEKNQNPLYFREENYFLSPHQLVKTINSLAN